VRRLLRAWLDEAESIVAMHGPGPAVERLIAQLPAAPLIELTEALATLVGVVELDADATVLDADQVRELADTGWEIGAHTVEHVVLTHEPAARVRHELRRARTDLETWSGRPCRFFAYCNGLYSEHIVDAVRAAGYQAAVTTFDRPNRPGSDPMRISRKVLWEAHTAGLDGRWSRAVSAANLHDLFGELGLTQPIDGEVHKEEEPWGHAAA
jgi:hypothetical protein